MKKLTYYVLLAIAGLYFTSCTEDSELPGGTVEPIPTVTIPSTAPTTAQPGDVIEFTVAVVAEARLESIEVRRTDVSPALTIDRKTSGFTNNTSDNYFFSVTMTEQEAGQTVVLEFIATDRQNRTNNPATLSIEVAAATQELTEVTLGGVQNNTLGSFFELSTQQVQNITYTNQNSSEIDFAYSWGTQGSEANIFSLSDPIADNFFDTNTNNWSNLKNTQFKQLSTSEGVSLYNSAVTEADIKGYYDNAGDAVSRLTNLEGDDVFVIKIDNDNADEGFYIVKVNSVATGSAGSISLDIKGLF